MTAICSICQEKLQCGAAVVLSLCGHVLCEGCLHQWASRNNPANRVDCPMCRKKHSYPRQTHKLYFEEEQNQAEFFRNELRNVMNQVERCTGDGNSVKGVIAELKKLSDEAKRLDDPSVTQATTSGLDAMITHLSKKLTPLRSAEELEHSLADTLRELDRIVKENKNSVNQRKELEAKLAAQRSETEAKARAIEAMRQESERARRLELQMAKMKAEQEALKKELRKVQEEKELAREKILVLKRKNNNLITTNESLKVDLNLSLSTRLPPSQPTPTKRHSRGSIISIPSHSSPETKFVTLVSSDDEGRKPSESSSVQFISDDDDEPVPVFREIKQKIKPVKPLLFQQTLQASTSRPPKSAQKRKLATSVPNTPANGGLELRNGKLTGLAATGPKRSKKA
ncbi:TRAF-interacting protein [Rhizoctonia solani AG-1 IB]|uniref:TRAF-interacting protein n=1 Tax=Thanatephorus cucumeris (strain AG1-IB / isolate 7/3/14) TaxID=1108050 RepID=A0A0B7FNJ2_THACB|nr:TRAF-interacting protein [Rhizoctonia solani AG-1 IB]